MIRSLSLRINPMRDKPPSQPLRNKHKIKTLRLFDEIHRMNAHRGRVRLTGMQHEPGIAKVPYAIVERGEDQGVLVSRCGKVHVAAQQRLCRPGKHLEAAALFFNQGRPSRHGAGLGMQAANGVDLGPALEG